MGYTVVVRNFDGLEMVKRHFDQLAIADAVAENWESQSDGRYEVVVVNESGSAYWNEQYARFN